MKIRTRLAVASLITIAVLSVAGCGGDDGPSRQEFIAQADAICQKANKGPLAEGKYGENFSKAAFLSRTPPGRPTAGTPTTRSWTS